MQFRKISAVFESDNLVLAEELICDIFFSCRLKGVECILPLPEPDEGFGTQTLSPPAENAIIGHLPDTDTADIYIKTIRERCQALSRFDIRVEIRDETVDEKEWADAWKQYFNVTPITDRIVIRPEWKAYDPKPDDIVILLDPGMAFGTGTHPTTAMCLGRIETHLVPEATFLDVGCGSGILMIAAAKMGASRLTGLDTDESAVGIARENMEKNSIDPDTYDLVHGPLDKLGPGTYDLIAANIIAQVLVNIMGDIRLRMSDTSLAVLSGIIRERQADVETALSANDLAIIHEDVRDEWVTLTIACKPGSA